MIGKFLRFENSAFLIFSFGCTLVSTEAPDNVTVSTRTFSSDPKFVGFYLYPNASDTTYAEEIKVGDSSSLTNSRYDSTKSLVVLIHGFLNNYTTAFSQQVKNAFLDNGYGTTSNIVVVDWGKLAGPDQKFYSVLGEDSNWALLSYPFILANVPRVAKRVADFIVFLRDTRALSSVSNVHIVGFSLGAHISGLAGLSVTQSGSEPIGRITGLDPAGPFFGSPFPLDKRLRVTDARLVDIIHTDGGQMGFLGDLGSVDFYANGGIPVQPGCRKSVWDLSELIIGSCSHNRAWKYFIASMTGNITACKCTTYADFLGQCGQQCPAFAVVGQSKTTTSTMPTGRYYFNIQLPND